MLLKENSPTGLWPVGLHLFQWGYELSMDLGGVKGQRLGFGLNAFKRLAYPAWSCPARQVRDCLLPD